MTPLSAPPSVPGSGTGFGPDDATHQAFARLVRDQPWLLDAGEVVAVALHPWSVRGVVAAGCLLAWRAGHWRRALVVAATMLVGSALGAGLKLLVRRDRPPFGDDMAAEIGYSMPSGHALNGTLAAGLVVVLLWPWLRRRGARGLAVAGAGAVALVVSLDRLVMGVHYLSDVAVGAAIGVIGTAAAARLSGTREGGPRDGRGARTRGVAARPA